jgi:hypothetical protein
VQAGYGGQFQLQRERKDVLLLMMFWHGVGVYTGGGLACVSCIGGGFLTQAIVVLNAGDRLEVLVLACSWIVCGRTGTFPWRYAGVACTVMRCSRQCCDIACDSSRLRAVAAG